MPESDNTAADDALDLRQSPNVAKMPPEQVIPRLRIREASEKSLVRGLLLCFCAVWTNVSAATAQFHETFDGPTPSWQRQETDCSFNRSRWRQTRANELELRNRFEKIAFRCGAGTKLLISHKVPPAHVINELHASVRIKASRPGMRLLARVVLPHVAAVDGDAPMMALLRGPSSDTVGQWQTLAFGDGTDSISPSLKKLLKEELWLLRRKFGAHITDKDAYVDKLVLDLYSSAGETIVQIDDAKLNGIADASRLAKQIDAFGKLTAGPQVVHASPDTASDPTFVQPTSLQRASGKQPSLVVRDGTVLLVRKQPFFPRIIQHNGEPFNFLKALGFNTIELKTTPTTEQLNEARRLELWLVCPPPGSVGLAPIPFSYDRVLAWSVGHDLTGRNIDSVQQRIREIRESDQREGRPIVAHANSHWSRLSQDADVLAIGLQPLGTSFIASRYSDWIAQRIQSINNSKPVWADVQTELSRTILDQVSAIASQVPPTPIEPQQLKFLVYEALASGARGLRFQSRSRLDASDPVNLLRSQTIEWVNGHLDQIEPWAVGGALMGELPLGDASLEVTALQTPRSRLLLVQRPTHHEQYWAGDVPPTTVTFQDTSATYTDRAYRITESGLAPLPTQRSPEGNQIEIADCPYTAAVVLTQDSLAINRVTEATARAGQQSLFGLHTELSRQWLAIMQLIDRQMTLSGRNSPPASGGLNEAINAFRTVNSLDARNSAEAAYKYLDQVDERLAFARREFVSQPLGQFQSKMSTPFAAHASLIPLHWELSTRLADSQWNPNSLAGGDFENLQHMQTAGWENQRIDDDRFQTSVELAEAARVDGHYGCRLSVDATSTSNGVIETAPLWIASPQIPIKGGQLVRIHGWVNVPNTILANHDGLTITDTLSGNDMIERIPVTDGWQEFTLYRAARAKTSLKITFALTGSGEALIDEVTVRTIQLNSPSRQARIR